MHDRKLGDGEARTTRACSSACSSRGRGSRSGSCRLLNRIGRLHECVNRRWRRAEGYELRRDAMARSVVSVPTRNDRHGDDLPAGTARRLNLNRRLQCVVDRRRHWACETDGCRGWRG